MNTTYATYTLSGKEFDIYNNDFTQKNEYRFKSYFQSLAFPTLFFEILLVDSSV